MDIVESVKKAYKKITDTVTGKGNGRYWDMSEPETRETSVLQDYTHFQAVRSPQQEKWVKFDKYYNNEHVASAELADALDKDGIPFIPAIVPAPYIHVESQIIPDAPDFQFKGRDNDLDNQKAKQREYVVQSIIDENKIDTMVTQNERRLNKLGNAFWKVSYDGSIVDGQTVGKIIIGNPDPANIFPDPSAIDLQNCEAFIYPYRLHRRAAARQFAKQLADVGITMDEIGSDGKQGDTQFYVNQSADMFDDTVQIIEYWFKQAEYGNSTKEYEYVDDFGNQKKATKRISWEPGDIACSIQINNKEIQYIPKYWIKTGKQNKRYPFVKYCKIPNENAFWDKSDIEMIIPLTDQCDRELATAILNDTFMANDITVVEEHAIADGCEIENKPGAIWKMKDGKINSARRLANMANPTNRLEMINFLMDLIQKTVGNYDSNMGQEPVRVTTSSGIAQLNERADARKNIKKADRTTGFELLYELLDWTALEFYDDNRLVFIGAEGEQPQQQQPQQPMQGLPQNMDKSKGPVIFKFNSDNMRVLDGTGEEPQYYYPRIDATVTAGDGLNKSKSFTLSILEKLSQTQVTPANYKIVEATIDLADIPQKKEIKEFYEKLFSQPAEPKVEPKISASYKDLPVDAQIQWLAKEGIDSKGGTQVPQQASEQPQKLDPNHVLQGLSPEELQAFKNLPEEEQMKMLNGAMGGQ